jgi:hypothetical protein
MASFLALWAIQTVPAAAASASSVPGDWLGYRIADARKRPVGGMPGIGDTSGES